MSKRKWALSRKLTRPHLEAIGRVTAEWSLLEIAILYALAETGGVKITSTIVLAAPSAFASWVDMLAIFSRRPEQKHKEDAFAEICKLLLKLQKLRNYIVHATWEDRKKTSGLIGHLINPDLVVELPREIAKGYGVPKRGRDILIDVTWTVSQMRHVARLIEESRSMLREIADRKQPTSPREHDALALLDQTNRRRIREMLDSLPDPFHE